MTDYSDAAWNIAGRYSYILASETRDLAGAIDAELAALRAKVDELTALVEGGLNAVNAARNEGVAEAQGLERSADRHGKIADDWMKSARKALAVNSQHSDGGAGDSK